MKPVKRGELVKILEGLETRFAQRMRRVLVLEDDARQLESLRPLPASRDVETVEARTGAECLEQLASGTFDCMVLALHLPDASGLRVLELQSLVEDAHFPPVIVYNGQQLSPNTE